MQEQLTEQLRNIAKRKKFKKDEYVFYEGQPGSEMYIILNGAVGVFLIGSLGELTQIAEVNEGEFFGEMAIFDNLPRSASCIAIEDTECIAITKDDLGEFIAKCPSLATKMVENMSKRIRKLNNDMFMTKKGKIKENFKEFAIPNEYKVGFASKKVTQDSKYYAGTEGLCPICHKEINIVNLKKNLMKIKKIGLDGRIIYDKCEPMWYEVQSCPHCSYSNYYLNFFKVNVLELDEINRVITEEQIPELNKVEGELTEFDRLVFRYLQAINLNEIINSDDNDLIGSMWIKLYWLSRDCNNDKFALYCAKKTINKYRDAIENEQIQDEIRKSSMALSLANLLIYVSKENEAKKYGSIALESSDSRIKHNAKIFMKKF